MQFKTIGNFLVPPEILKPFNWDRPQDDYDIVRIRKDYFDLAKKRGMYLLAQSKNGERVFMPKAMKRQKVYNEIMLYPDNPMKMYELIIPKCEKKPVESYQFPA